MDRNILISTIKDFDSHTTIRYYYSHRNHKLEFCDAMAAGEAGAKNVLSKVAIDEIIAIGSNLQAMDCDVQKTVLRDGIDFFSSDIYTMSDFDFFRYRLVQFLEEMDIEAADLYGKVEKTRQNEIITLLKSVFDSHIETAFLQMTKDSSLWDQTLSTLEGLTANELEWAKRYLYHSMEHQYKIRPISQNNDIAISFIPISRIGLDRNSMKDISRLTAALKRSAKERIHLYVDMHGFSHEESYIFLSLIQALSDNPSNNIVIEEITSINEIPKGFIYKLSNARDRYKVEMLLSGINAFINYGKVDLIREYWKNTAIKNDYIDKFMYAMDAVDTGVSLCNIDELEHGIRLLGNIIHEDISDDIDQEEESFILALRAGIINDYGSLVADTEGDIDLLDLLKWAFSKGFYQQTITIIESRLPEDIVKRGILYYAENEDEKTAYLKAINSHYWDSSQKDRYVFQNPDHYFIKYYGRFMTAYYPKSENRNLDYAMIHANQVFGPQDFCLKAHSYIEERDELISILTAYYDICNLRNSINHATRSGAAKDADINYTGESLLKRMYHERLNQFIRQYSDVAAKIQGLHHEIVLVSPEELEAYTGAHGPKDDPECFASPGYIIMRDRKKKKL